LQLRQDRRPEQFLGDGVAVAGPVAVLLVAGADVAAAAAVVAAAAHPRAAGAPHPHVREEAGSLPTPRAGVLLQPRPPRPRPGEQVTADHGRQHVGHHNDVAGVVGQAPAVEPAGLFDPALVSAPPGRILPLVDVVPGVVTDVLAVEQDLADGGRVPATLGL